MCVCMSTFMHVYARRRQRTISRSTLIDSSQRLRFLLFSPSTPRAHYVFPPSFSISPMKPEFYLRRLTGNPVETRDDESRQRFE